MPGQPAATATAERHLAVLVYLLWTETHHRGRERGEERTEGKMKAGKEERERRERWEKKEWASEERMGRGEEKRREREGLEEDGGRKGTK